MNFLYLFWSVVEVECGVRAVHTHRVCGTLVVSVQTEIKNIYISSVSVLNLTRNCVQSEHKAKYLGKSIQYTFTSYSTSSMDGVAAPILEFGTGKGVRNVHIFK